MEKGRGLMSIMQKGLIGAVAAGMLAAACSSAPVAAEVRTAQVARGAVTQTVAVSGSVSSAGTVKLNPATNGKVAQLYVTVGQQVTAGQPLAKLDTTDLQAALTTAQNNVDAAQTNYNKALSGVSDAQSSYAQTQQSTANDIATAQQALVKLKSSYTAAKTAIVISPTCSPNWMPVGASRKPAARAPSRTTPPRNVADTRSSSTAIPVPSTRS